MIISRMRLLFVVAACGTAILSLPYGSNPALRVAAAAAFAAGALMWQDTDDDVIFTLATGELLVIAVAEAFFPAGFIAQCAVAGAALVGGKEPAGAWDIPLFVLYSLTAIIGAIVLDRSNQVFLPFLALVAVVAGVAALATGIQEMQERRKFTGGAP